MRKLPWLCLAFAALLYSGTAQSRICFLADTDCQVGVKETKIENSKPCKSKPGSGSWVLERDRCKFMTYKSVCNDYKGNYYEPIGCAAGYTDMTDPNVKDKFICNSTSTNCSNGRCCKNEELKCRPDIFKVCPSGTKPADASITGQDTCKEKTPDAVDKFTLCYCDTSVYKYSQSNCGADGLKLTGDSCNADNGHWTKSCSCDTIYSKVAYSEISCKSTCQWGCSDIGYYTQLPDTSYYCWKGNTCAPKPANVCPISGYSKEYSDFDNYWVGYDSAGSCKNLNVNCSDLGYKTGTLASGKKCKDGSDPYRCPFDHEQVFCETGICNYYTQQECEDANSNYVCAKNSTDVCWVTSGCRTGFYPSSGSCLPCAHTTKSSCEGAYANAVCTADSYSCFKPTGCKANFCGNGNPCSIVCGSAYKYTSTSKPANSTPSGNKCTGYTGTSAGACSGSSVDRYDSFTCDTGYKKSGDTCVAECTYADEAACESANSKSDCTADSYGCYKPTACKSGYAKSCSSGYTLSSKDSYGCGTCSASCTYASQVACQYANANSNCTYSDGCYKPTSCKDGYKKFCTGGVPQNPDNSGCGTCNASIPPINPAGCCAKNYKYDCTSLGKGCSDVDLGTRLNACMPCNPSGGLGGITIGGGLTGGIGL